MTRRQLRDGRPLMSVAQAAREHVFLASNTWTDQWITQQPVSNEIQRTERLLYVERPVSVFTVLRYPHLWRRLFVWALGARRRTVNLRLLAPLPLFHLGHRFPRVFAAEFALQRIWIRLWAGRAGSAGRVLWLDNPLYECAFGRMGETLRVYYAADEFAAFPQSHRLTAEMLEQRALERADVVFAASTGLAAAKRAFNRRTYPIWNAIDRGVFDAPEPAGAVEEVERVPVPRAAFVGVIDEWVDVPLLCAVAGLLPHVHFLVVATARADLGSLRRNPNVHWLGRRPREEVPAVLRRCSASLVPFRLGALTENILPLKVFEALAVGTVPVCTPFSADIRELAAQGLALVADGPDAFAAAVQAAVRSDTPQSRDRLRAFGGRQTWSERWRRMASLLTEAEAALEARPGPIPEVEGDR